ncbi:MAG TPA: GrpB family protein [Xanthobacteraceae bacterium]|jgi:GrpB-like predicted nucleotidyltransferase (UPF0157 family)|nr:GrpB family protein [Xanthobacteraceae bacterium]
MMNHKDRRPENIAATEERLIAATVGNPVLLNKTVELEPYNPEWPRLFATLERQMREALGAKALMIAHVGSTSVPGLSAKPNIDVVLAVADSADEGSYVLPLERLGYGLRIREPDWFEHRMLKAAAIDGNIHVFSRGCSEIDRMLAFRDWLRSNEGDRKRYERTKQELAARTWKYMQNYADAKSEVVGEILERALGARHGR